MILKLQSREKINPHEVGNKVNEIIEELEIMQKEIDKLKNIPAGHAEKSEDAQTNSSSDSIQELNKQEDKNGI